MPFLKPKPIKYAVSCMAYKLDTSNGNFSVSHFASWVAADTEDEAKEKANSLLALSFPDSGGWSFRGFSTMRIL